MPTRDIPDADAENLGQLWAAWQAADPTSAERVEAEWRLWAAIHDACDPEGNATTPQVVRLSTGRERLLVALPDGQEVIVGSGTAGRPAIVLEFEIAAIPLA